MGFKSKSAASQNVRNRLSSAFVFCVVNHLASRWPWSSALFLSHNNTWVSSSIIFLPRLTLLCFPPYAYRFNNVANNTNFVPVLAKHARLLLVIGNEARYVGRSFNALSPMPAKPPEVRGLPNVATPVRVPEGFAHRAPSDVAY